MKYKRYEKYKDSGVEWIGEVPENWVIGNLRWYLSCKSGDFITNTEVSKEKTEDKKIPVIGGNGVMGFCNRYNINDKTIAVGRVGALCGNIHLIDYICWITDNSLIINYINENIDIGYLELLLRSINLNRFSTSTAQPLITGETIKKRKICIPSKGQQKQISDFLDKKTREINSIIEDKQKLIFLLKEQRQSIINETVTKGLDPSVKIKDSGVEWIGEVPLDWEISVLKRYVIEHRQGYYTTDDYVDDGVNLIRITDIDDFANISIENCPKVNISKNEFKRYEVKKGDVLFARSGTIGRFGIANKDLNCVYASYLIKFKFINKLDISYLKYIFLSTYFKENLIGNLHGGANQNIHAENIKEQYVAFPCVKEQKEIAEYLDIKTSEIDSLISDIELQIEKLKAYRQSLIFEAVTGKIDLRDYK